MFGFGKNDLGFFRIPDLDLKLETMADHNPTGLVKVTGGTLTSEIVQAQQIGLDLGSITAQPRCFLSGLSFR
jgi:hypothetical protein